MPRFCIYYTETSHRVVEVEAKSLNSIKKAWPERDEWLFDQIECDSIEVDGGYCDSSEVIVKALK